jgi:signal transduction histidine kinase
VENTVRPERLDVRASLAMTAAPQRSTLALHWLTARRGVIAAAACSTLVAGTVIVVALADPGLSADRKLAVWLLATWAAGLLLATTAAWLTSAEHPAVAVGVAVATAGFAIPVWAGWEVLAPTLRAMASGVLPVAVAGVATVAVRWQRTPSPGRAYWLVVGLSIAAVVVHAAGYDPLRDPGCARTCLTVAAPARDLLTTQTAAGMSGLLMALACTASLLAIVIPARSRLPATVLWGSISALLLLAIAGLLRWPTWWHVLSVGVQLVPPVLAAGCFGSAVALAAGTMRRTRRAVAEVVAALEDPAGSWLTRHGPIRAVAFAAAGGDCWLDADGRSAPPTIHGAALFLHDGGAPVVRVHLPGSNDSALLAWEFSPAQWLAIRNARLAAVTRARLADLQASQMRIVADSDTERLRIERDLHDGAQQHLVAATFHLRAARGRIEASPAALDRTEEWLHSALAGLRRMARGMVPAELASGGLVPALEHLAIHSAVATEIDVAEIALGSAPAGVAYALVREAIDQAADDTLPLVRVIGRPHGGDLLLRIESPGSTGFETGRLQHMHDRVGAVGGSFSLERAPAGTVLEATIPCVS